MLLPAKDGLARRRWTWQAISDLFLDDEINETTLAYIAQVVAECGYSDKELDAIYRREVAPAVAFNYFVDGPLWGYWDSVWLEEQILRPRRIRYWFDRLIVAPLPLWLLRHEWKHVKQLLRERRDHVRQQQAELGDRWKPCWAGQAPNYRWASHENASSPST